jgi:hypothetical protein
LCRIPLRTPYPDVAKKVARIAALPIFQSPPRVVVDGTGIGIAVVEMIRTEMASRPEIEVWSCSITSGESFRAVRLYEMSVSKVQLVSAFREVLDSNRFKVARRPDGSVLRGAEQLKQELRSFKLRISQPPGWRALTTANHRHGT